MTDNQSTPQLEETPPNPLGEGGVSVSENVVWDEWYNAAEDDRHQYVPLLVRLLQRHAKGVCFQVLKRVDEGIVNDSIWQAMIHADKFDGEKSKFSTWFQNIVHHKCVDTARHASEITAYALAHKDDVSIESHENAVIEELDKQANIEEIVLGLKKRDRRFVKLILEGNDYEEIAEKLGKSGDYWRKKWFRVKSKVVRVVKQKEKGKL